MSPIPSRVAGLIEGRSLPAYLATWVRDRPRVAPVWYEVADGRLHTLASPTRREEVEQNPAVAAYIQNDDTEDDWFVTLRGTATVSRDRTDINDAARSIYPRYLGPDPAEWDSTRRADLGADPNHYLVTIDVDSAVVEDDPPEF